MAVTKYLGLDLGGTNIKVAVIEKIDNKWQVIKKDDQVYGVATKNEW